MKIFRGAKLALLVALGSKKLGFYWKNLINFFIGENTVGQNEVRQDAAL